MSSSNRYLTKSRFKEALECFTKLYYTRKPEEYANQSLDDPFLKTLANGGFQVGELAKFMFSNNPIGEEKTIQTINYDDSLSETLKRMNSGSEKIVIAEAAFKYNNLFIRADIVEIKNKHINLYEVKAKSTSFDDKIENYYAYYGKANEKIHSKWFSYLYDLAFQKYVISKAFPDYSIHAHMIMPNKDLKASIDGLNQLFQINQSSGNIKVNIPEDLRADQLGNTILEIVNFDDIIDKIWNQFEVPTNLPQKFNFEEFINLCEEKYVKNERVFVPVSSTCKKCTYYKKASDPAHLKSGLMECWKNTTNYDDHLLEKEFIFNLWGGGADKHIKEGVYLLENLNPDNLNEKKSNENEIGLTSVERKKLQVIKAKNQDTNYYFDKKGFENELNSWKYPFHLIDFETATVALPFHKNTRPYQGIAFQFSHHIIHENGTIEHVNQFINFEKGVYPNLEFIRSLKKALSNDNGTIFRYHNHENTYLNLIKKQIELDEIEITSDEKNDLIHFITSITTEGNRAMVDLFKIVTAFYYSPSTKGKNGLKYILPALINDSDYLKNKYSANNVYGLNKPIKSLNFENQIWIQEAHKLDPYKTLPKIFENQMDDAIEKIENELDIDGIADGGAALTAYNLLQYTNISDEDKEKIKNGLLRYCELDTMAMVMLIEGFINLNEKIN
jgi:hypothetical protein